MISPDKIYARFETIYSIRHKYLRFMLEIGGVYGPAFIWTPYDAVTSLERSITSRPNYRKRWLLEEIRK